LAEREHQKTTIEEFQPLFDASFFEQAFEDLEGTTNWIERPITFMTRDVVIVLGVLSTLNLLLMMVLILCLVYRKKTTKNAGKILYFLINF
jgi:hypothetical protein